MDPSLLDTTFWLTVGAIFVLLLCSAFFSASETALTAASRAKLRAQADKGARGAETALKVTEDSERMIGALLLGNNLVNILAASLATALFTRLIGESGVALATLVMTALVLIFAEVLPKTWAITAPEPAALRLAPVVRVVVRLLSPLVAAVRAFVRLVLRAFGVRADPDSRFLALREEIAGAIALGHHEGVVEREDRDRLLGALGLSDRTVEEVMRHRSEIEMIDADAEAGQIVHQALASPHTRLPLWRGEAENIVGVLHAKDLLRAVEQQ
ncbi:MAG: CNNM domain-containing protein, partial [Gemmobacter sp.]